MYLAQKPVDRKSRITTTVPASERPRLFLKYILEGQSITEDKIKTLEIPKQNLIRNAYVVDEFCQDKTEQELKLLADFILSSVYIVFVTTYSFKSAYRLFNVLNARGMPLSNADLIKNRLFEQLNGQVNSSNALEESWLELESIIGIERLDTFFGHYRTAQTANRASKTLHEEITDLIKKTGDPFDFLEAVIEAARQYVRILDQDLSDPLALRSLNALGRVKYEDWIPPLLTFLSIGVEGMSEAEFLDLLERITMQNWVRRLGTAARLTIYFQLIRAIIAQKPIEHIHDLFIEQANNEEFLKFLGSDIYGQPFTNPVLLRLEEASQDDSVTKTYSGLITIEHILPQTPSDPYWVERFSPEDHQQWANKLGNLTPLSGRKNYKAQNYSFDRKKEIYQEKLKKVSFDLTKDVCTHDEWTITAIEQRHAELLQLAQDIWFIP